MMLASNDPRLLQIDLRRDLLAAGHSDRSLASDLRFGTRERPRRGAYVDGPTWRSLDAEQKYAVRCRAAYQQAKTTVALSHISALPFHDAPIWGFDLADVHLTRSDGLSGRRESGIRRHCGVIEEGDLVDTNGIVVTSAARSVLEASFVGDVESGLVVANHLLHNGAVTAEELRARYDRSMDHWPHSLGTELVLRLADPRVESVGESRLLYFFFRRHFPMPVPQFEVHDGEVLIARLDFALPDHGIWIEFDGRVKYERHLRPGEAAVDVVLREKRREEQVMELTGWRCIRVTWSDLADPAGLERRIRRFIELASRARWSSTPRPA